MSDIHAREHVPTLPSGNSDGTASYSLRLYGVPDAADGEVDFADTTRQVGKNNRVYQYSFFFAAQETIASLVECQRSSPFVETSGPDGTWNGSTEMRSYRTSSTVRVSVPPGA